MYKKITVELLRPQHLEAILPIWQNRFAKFCADTPLYGPWREADGLVGQYLAAHAGQGLGAVARLDGEIAGFAAYDIVDYRGTRAAFVPVAGNATLWQNARPVCLALYKFLSRRWVEQGVKTHYYTLYKNDAETLATLFDLGFGASSVDCYALPQRIEPRVQDDILVGRAAPGDAEALYALVRSARQWFAASPIFLHQPEFTRADLALLYKQGNIFVAKHKGRLVGYINLSVAGRDDVYALVKKHFGMVDVIGAYTAGEYRGRSIGARLMAELSRLCVEQGLPVMHASYETANLYGSSFWQRHFTPVLLTVKRSVDLPDARE